MSNATQVIESQKFKNTSIGNHYVVQDIPKSAPRLLAGYDKSKRTPVFISETELNRHLLVTANSTEDLVNLAISFIQQEVFIGNSIFHVALNDNQEISNFIEDVSSIKTTIHKKLKLPTSSKELHKPEAQIYITKDCSKSIPSEMVVGIDSLFLFPCSATCNYKWLTEALEVMYLPRIFEQGRSAGFGVAAFANNQNFPTDNSDYAQMIFGNTWTKLDIKNHESATLIKGKQDPVEIVMAY